MARGPQHRIVEPGPLHNADGTVREPGWATEPLAQYRRSAVAAAKWRLKEWDYYCVLTDDAGIAVTVADNGYFGFASATVFDFNTPTEATKAKVTPFPMGRFRMPECSTPADVSLERRGFSMHFAADGSTRRIDISVERFHDGQDLTASIELAQPPDDTMVIATPFAEDPKAFYYNQKINCLPASGSASYGDRHIEFRPDRDFGVLDWGRGVWTYDNTWYWASASGLAGGRRFGLNLGYGFGDESAASENMAFVDGVAHKLGRVEFQIPTGDYLAPWTITDDEERLDLAFVPRLDRAADINLGLLRSDQHQVFGRYNGTLITDEGDTIEITDLMGFAEKVRNRW